jgi:hypothetical protein
MNILKVNDPVKVISSGIGKGKKGKVVYVDDEILDNKGYYKYLVNLGEKFKGHDAGIMDNNHNWWFRREDLELIQ